MEKLLVKLAATFPSGLSDDLDENKDNGKWRGQRLGKLGADKWNSFRIREGRKDVTYFRKREFSVISGDEEQVKEEQLASQELMLTLKEQGSESWGNRLRWNNGEMQNFRDKFPP